MTRIAIVPVALLLAGCHIGRSAEQLPYATGPHGARATLQCEHRVTVRGELLLVQDTALLVLQQGRVVLVRYSVIGYGEFESARVAIGNQDAPTAEARGKLRLLSRYPAGLTADQLQTLLGASGQVAPDSVSR